MSSAVNQRLHRLVGHIYPAALAQHDKDGTWPGPTAPFVMETTKDGLTRLKISDPDGGTVVGVGADLTAAINAVATKLRVTLDAPEG